MQWSNLNEQMIEQFFQNSNSPSNAQISLNFTRTSRQMGSNQKPNKDVSPRRLQISNTSNQQKPVNPENDILSFADKQISKFDSWMVQFNNDHHKHANRLDSQWQTIQQELFKHQNQSRPLKQSSLQNILLSKIDQVSKKIASLSYPKPCQNCALSEKKIFQLQTILKQLQTNLTAKTIELSKITQKQIKEIGHKLSFEVQNSLLNVRVDELLSKNAQLSETIQSKNNQLNKLSEEINKLHFEKSNFLSRTKGLQTRAQQLQKSKSFMMSAAKNSTSHSEFNITNQALMNKSQNHTNIETTLIHTNQFSADRPTADDYCIWFQRLKQVYLEKYKKEEKEHLKKFPELRGNENELRKEISNFKKGSARYEVARSWNTIASYVSKNKENFLHLISNEVGIGIKIPTFEGSNMTNVNSSTTNKENVKMIEFLQEELKKSQKKAEGHLSQIQNLNQQLINMKKTLLRQKEEKTKLSREVDELQEQLDQMKNELKATQQQLQSIDQSQSVLINKSINTNSKNLLNKQNQEPCIELVQELQQNLKELQRQVCVKSQQLKRVIYQLKSQEQSQIKLSQSIKECQRLLQKQRIQKIQYFKNSLPQQSLTIACRIRAKSVTQKKLPSLLHQIDSRIYVQKENLSYKFDVCEMSGKKSSDQIYSITKKLITNCLYEPSCSLILSMGSSDSQFSEYFRGQNGLIWNSITQIFKLKYTQKRFLQLDVAFTVIQIANSHIFDLLDQKKPKKLSFITQNHTLILQNSSKLLFQTQQQAKSTLKLIYSKQHQPFSHLITVVQFTITDKRNKHKFTSKIFFADIHLQNPSNQADIHLHNPSNQADINLRNPSNQDISIGQNLLKAQNLLKDTKALWNALKSINFNQPLQKDSNRLTCLFSQCFNQKAKNLMIINASPTELHKKQSLYSLNYVSSLKHIATQKSQSLIRYKQKSPQHSVSVLKHKSSHSLIQTPTLNPDSFEDKTRSMTKHRNSSSQHTTYGIENGNSSSQNTTYKIENAYSRSRHTLQEIENGQRKKRTISRLSIC